MAQARHLALAAAPAAALAWALCAGPAPPAAAALPTPVVRLTLAEGHQSVRINGVLVGRLGEALGGRAGRVRAALGPRDGCRVTAPGQIPATVSRWRATGVAVRTEPTSGPADCDSPSDPVLRLTATAPPARIVTERGTVRVGRPLPARLRASAGRMRAFGSRRVVTWPLADPCDGKLLPGSTALLVRSTGETVESVSVYTGITDVITCSP